MKAENMKQKSALADQKAFNNAWLSHTRARFNEGGRCAARSEPTVELGVVNTFPPPGYDFGITEGAPFFTVTQMWLPTSLATDDAAFEVLRTFGIRGDHFNAKPAQTGGIPNCDYIVFYGTRALNAGAPGKNA
jgi:hypothetical protein